MRFRIYWLVLLSLAAGSHDFFLCRQAVGQEPEQVAANRQGILQWIISLKGEYDLDADRPGKPVIHVRLDRTRGIDPGGSPDELRVEDLALLNQIPDLQSLTLALRPNFTDAGFAYLSRLKSLESLNLSGTRIRGKGLGLLAGLNDLRQLSLQYCSSLNLSEVGALTQLEQLCLDNIGSTRVGDQRWAYLPRGLTISKSELHRSIQSRNTYRAGVDDDQAEFLAPLSNLKALSRCSRTVRS